MSLNIAAVDQPHFFPIGTVRAGLFGRVDDPRGSAEGRLVCVALLQNARPVAGRHGRALVIFSINGLNKELFMLTEEIYKQALGQPAAPGISGKQSGS